MRRWSRLVAVLCITYLVALLLFHRQLDTSSNAVANNDDYLDSLEEPEAPPAAHRMVTSVSAANESAKRDVPGGPPFLKKQLKQLEMGVSRLEKEILHVKQRLARDVMHHVTDDVTEGQKQQQGQKSHDQRVVLMEQVPVKLPQQPIILRPDGIPIPIRQNVKNGRVPGGAAHVIGRPVTEGGAPPVVEDYTNTSLVKIGEGVAVYSAYHDDRIVDKPYVRLIVILSAPKPQRGVLCHFHHSSAAVPVTVESLQYELCENHKKKYLGFIYSCPLPPELSGKTYNLSLSLNYSANVKVAFPTQHVTPVEVRTGQVSLDNYHFKYNFSICVSPLFGSVNPKRLIEFLELSRLLGAQQVFFYDFQTSSVIQRVLRYYQDKGWVTVLPWKLPKAMDGPKIWYHGQLITNNDCLYRTMAVSKFTAFHDIDEFIVPHAEGVRTWGELFPPSLPNDTCGFYFKSAFYDPGVTNFLFSDDLMTVGLTARPSMLSRIRTKVMAAPRRVFEVGIHHISKQLLEHWQPRPYDPNMALLHHYRQCIRDFGMRCENWVKDTIIKDKYLPQLKDNFLEVVRVLGL